ncbi:sulfatase-like hydrolase/transferase [Luteolibacter ambystomatis]|uniref:Sulfatase-like hydrolase/transferase n=1 Tax=Luteolibacter ambystomatis TaxID=2824561 RepID=A0A975IYK4_9BACT|nr:sulfatase-like hydrolase/transferase [Luteolibacter ambystomatis]QUE49978.1 sulfatase-like hydrolase/transferase [Luteolibacter ambystomatis]
MKIPALFSLALMIIFGPLALAEAPAPRPNIIYILTDDLGYGDVGAFFQKQLAEKKLPAEMTPVLDKMADEGIQLRGHYCPAPVCAPSRASFLSGVHQGHANVRDNQFDKALEDNHTVASVLKGAGYSTAVIGKWGLQGSPSGGDGEVDEAKGQKTGSPETWPAYPTKRGFDYFFGYVRHADGHEHYPKEGAYRGAKQVWDGNKEISAQLDKCYTTDLFTARAKKWIVDQKTSAPDKPFFLYLAYDTPHATTELPTGPYPLGGGLKGGMQWTGKPGRMITSATGKVDSYCYPEFANATYTGPQWFGKKDPTVQKRPWPDVFKRYATSVHRIDDCVGDLVKLLKDLKIDDNTLLVFTTDNGPSNESYLKQQQLQPNFFRSFGPFDGIKRDCWEGGIRTGAIVRWPASVPAKRVNEAPCQAHDWMTTFAEMAGVPAPARADGVSLMPTLTGKGEQKPSTVYVEYSVAGRTPSFPEFDASHRDRQRGQMQVIRLGDMTGVRYAVKSHADDFEIYNVVQDPQQTKNLAAQNSALQQEMKDKVLQLRRPSSAAKRPYDSELVPADKVAQPEPGVVWKAYEGEFPWLPKFDTMSLSKSGVSPRPAVSDLSREENAGMLWSGFIQVPADGEYTFFCKADAGVSLRLHDAMVIDGGFGSKAVEQEGKVLLKAGLHAFRLYYAHRSGTPALGFEWSGPGIGRQPVPASAFSH